MSQNPTSDQKNTILIVDDSEDMRYLLGQILEGAEYSVIFAENGQEALSQAKLHHPNLILMDLSLPIMSGWEAVVHLRQMSEFDDTPIIAVTAHVTKQEEERARSAGCTAHIGKPFDFTVLLDCIATLLIECQRSRAGSSPGQGQATAPTYQATRDLPYYGQAYHAPSPPAP